MALLIPKLFKKEVALESAMFVFFFTILQRVIQVIRGVVFARLLGPAEYGLYNLAFFLIPLIVGFARLGISSSFSRYIPQYEKKGMLRDFLKLTYSLSIISAVIVTVLGLLFSRQISGLVYGTSKSNLLTIICILIIIPHVCYDNLMSTFRGLRIFKLSSFLTFGQFLIFTVLGIVLLFFLPKAQSLITAYLVSIILVAVVLSLILKGYMSKYEARNIPIEHKGFYSKILKYSVWFFFAPVVGVLFNYTDRWMLNRFMGLEEVGIYSIAINVTHVIFLFGMIAGMVLMPNLSHIWEKGDKDRVVSLLNLSVKINVVFLMFLAVILSLFKEQVVSILYGQLYIESLSVINILLIFSLLTSISWTLVGYSGIIEKTYIFPISSAIGFVSNVILNYILIPQYQMKGAAIATTISFIICFVIMNAWLYKEGFRLKAATVFLCIIPGSLMLSNMLMSIIFVALIAMILGTNFIIEKDEKILVLEQVRKAVSKYRRF